jgi:hypothetical protein
MKTITALLLLVLAIPVVSQQTETYWFPTNDPYISWGNLTLHRAHDGIVCIGGYDSSFRRNGGDYTTGKMFLGLPEAQGYLKYHTLLERSEQRIQDLGGTHESYDYDACEASRGAVLLVTGRSEWESNCFGAKFLKAHPGKLHMLEANRFKEIAQWSSVRKPVLLATSSGEAWVAMERVSLIPQPSDTMDMRYKANIYVSRITENHAVIDGRWIGEGYNPQLIQRTDGAIFVLRRESEHSASRNNVRLLLRRVDEPTSDDIVVAEGLNYTYDSRERMALLTGRDNSIHILRSDGQAMNYYYCDPELRVQHGGSTSALHSDASVAFITREDGAPVLFWKRNSNDDISWSEVSQNTLFGVIRSVPGTAFSSYSVSAVPGQDGKLKLLFKSKQESLFMIRDAMAPAPELIPLFQPSGTSTAIKEWLLHDDGTLWVTHLTYRDANPALRGLTRITGFTLGNDDLPVATNASGVLSNHPNPFTTNTSIVIDLPNTSTVTLVVVDALGREVRQVCREARYDAGKHIFEFESRNLVPGVYFARFISAGGILSNRMLLLQ